MMVVVWKLLSFCVYGVDGVEGAAGKRHVSVEVATQYVFNGTLGYGLCVYVYVCAWVGVCMHVIITLYESNPMIKTILLCVASSSNSQYDGCN